MEKYEAVEITIISFDAEDVITGSCHKCDQGMGF